MEIRHFKHLISLTPSQSFFHFPPQMYNFTNFAMSLNEMEPGMEGTVAPTDCRFRPDIRAMENGLMGNSLY